MIYPWVEWESDGHFIGGGGPSVSGNATPGPARVALPTTAGEVRTNSLAHSLGLVAVPDDFQFTHWITIVPEPVARTDSPSEKLLHEKNPLGLALPPEVLLVTLTDGRGRPDRAAAGTWLQALDYEEEDAPLLVFTSAPELVIADSYGTLEKTFFGEWSEGLTDGLVVPLGGSHPKAMKGLIEGVPRCFSGDRLRLNDLEKVVLECARTSKRLHTKDAGRKYGSLAVTVLYKLAKIVITGEGS